MTGLHLFLLSIKSIRVIGVSQMLQSSLISSVDMIDHGIIRRQNESMDR